MTDLIKVITAPDIVYDQSYKILIINPADDLKLNLEQWALNSNKHLSIYYYTAEDSDLSWLLTVANISDLILLDLDNLTANVEILQSYLISLPQTHYRCKNVKAPWHLLNKNRFWDFPTIKEYNNEQQQN